MICPPCRESWHDLCPGGTWCPCQHREPEPDPTPEQLRPRTTQEGRGDS